MALELVVVTPEGEAFAETVDQVVLPGEAGEFGVLESHERFLTPLAAGPMEVQSGGNSRWAALSGGFAEVDGCLIDTGIASIWDDCLRVIQLAVWAPHFSGRSNRRRH